MVRRSQKLRLALGTLVGTVAALALATGGQWVAAALVLAIVLATPALVLAIARRQP